jgi:hypothetical protein
MTIKCNAIIRTFADLHSFVDHVTKRLHATPGGWNPELAVPLEIWLDERAGGPLKVARELYWSKADVEDLLDMEEADRQLRETDPWCACHMETVNSASTEPPELIRDEWCPIHGRDAELDRRRDDAMERDAKLEDL